MDKLVFRRQLKKSDVPFIRETLELSGFFYDFEVTVALELAEENLSKGEEQSGYIFTIVEKDDHPVAFATYGKTPCTADSFDLYWIAVNPRQVGTGIGKQLMNWIKNDIRQLGGEKIWIETSSRPIYEPTRQFYLKYGCEIIAELPEFYGKDDNKVIYLLKASA